MGAGPLGKDIEDQARARQNSGLDERLEVPLLSGGQVLVEDDQIGLKGLHLIPERLRATRTEEGAPIGLAPLRRLQGQHLGAGGPGKLKKLLRLRVRLPFQGNRDQQGAFSARFPFKKEVGDRGLAP